MEKQTRNLIHNNYYGARLTSVMTITSFFVTC